MDDFLRLSSRTLVSIGEKLGIRNLDSDPGLIFITGGSGVVGHRVALRLLNAGFPSVRLGTHDKDTVTEMKDLGAEFAAFAWDQEDTYEKSLKGVKSVFCTVPYTEGWEKHFPAFLDACKKAGVKHFVKMSFYHARIMGDPMQEIPLAQAHAECDDLLVKMLTPAVKNLMTGDVDVGVDFTTPNMSYTILYASHYMSNPLVLQGKELREGATPGAFYGASGNHGVNYVSPNDVAEVATRVLIEPRTHYNKEYTLTGPEAIHDQQVADLLGKHLNRPVMYVDQPLHVYMGEMKSEGEAAWMVRDLAAMEKVKASGTEEEKNFLSADIMNICGHPAESFRDYLERYDTMTKAELGNQTKLTA